MTDNEKRCKLFKKQIEEEQRDFQKKFDEIKSKLDKENREKQAEINRLSRGIHDFEKEIADSKKTEKRQRIVSEISRLERETRDMEKAFVSLAKRCKIEWYCNKWMNEKPTLENFKYWTS